MAFDIFNYLAEKAVGGEGDKIFGTRPKVADFVPTDLGVESGKAVKANLSNFADVQAYLEKVLPGWQEMLKTGSASTLSLLKGEIPKDVQDSIRRSGAFKSLTGGFAGSGMSRALVARDIGRTSLDLTQLGQNSMERWSNAAEKANAPFTVTGPAQAETTSRNNLYKQITEQFRFNTEAAPDPTAAGVFNLQTALGSMAASFGMGSAMQGMRGSGGGGGQQVQQQPAPNYASNPYVGVNWQNPWGY